MNMLRPSFVQAWLVFLLGLMLTLGVDLYGQRRAEQSVREDTSAQLAVASQRLSLLLADVLQLSKELSARVASQVPLDEAQWQRMATETRARHRHIVNLTVSQGTVVTRVHPVRGNESVLGLDYRLRPEQMAGVRRAIEGRQGVLTGPVRLVQSERLAVVSRIPMFAAPKAGQPGPLLGIVSVAIELEGLLADAGLESDTLLFDYAITSDAGGHAASQLFWGDARLFHGDHSLKVPVPLPQGQWQIAAYPKAQALAQAWRPWPIRIGGVLVSLVLAGMSFLAVRIRHSRATANATDSSERSVGLQVIIIGALLFMVLPAVVVQGWFSYRTAVSTAERFQAEMASEVGARVYDKVVQFFEVPSRVLTFNAEQFRAGALDLNDTAAVSRNFLLQIRQQPLLTFLSVGTAQGDYLAASRPPVGRDKGLRLLEARADLQRVMHIHRVDDAHRRGEVISRGSHHFDARTRPWFKAAVASQGAGWYPAYRYAIDDEAGTYDAMGMGMSAPLVDAQQRFIGVVTADVALSQLNVLLADITQDMGGVIFLAERDGHLLASSTKEPVYRLTGSGGDRISAPSSSNAVIQAAGKAMREQGQPRGRAFREVDGERHLIDWWTHQLPDGPSITIGVVMPQSRFAAPSEGLLGNVLLVAVLLMAGGLLVAWLLSVRLARPLVSLSQWAQRLGRGDWSTPHNAGSAIAEVQTLSHALGHMAAQIRDHTEELTRQVADRTAELEKANRVLSELSQTDGLTGVANRRHFDEMLVHEWARAMRSGEALALIMVDVDHFKLFNDRYGHLAGDDCLQAIARVLTEQCRRAGDLPARYGGEEFVILVADENAAGALHLAERVRAAIEALSMSHADSAHAVVTVSLGVAILRPARGVLAQSLISRADAALYRAKRGGRNRVEVADT
jgi:diguanylate cyclase (GGDEF)-like protein